MKKRVLSLLLVAAMLVSLVVMAAYATTELDTCPCGCGEKVADIAWTKWTGEDDPASGHYYLESDLFTSQATSIGSANNLDAKIVLDLNGNTWASLSDNVANIGLAENTIEFTLIDSVGGGALLGKGSATGDVGVLSVANGATLNIYGGTLRHLYDEAVAVTKAGVLYVNGATVNMHDGQIADGYNTTADKTVASAGNVLLANAAKFNMHGGKIINGYSAMAAGGIYVTYDSEFMMDDGTISNNIAMDIGGNIYNEGKVTITGATAVVENGIAAGRVASGNSYQSSHRGKGGNIFNAEITVGGAKKYATLTLDGVQGVKGDLYNMTGGVALKGLVKIPMGNSNGILLRTNQKLNIANLDPNSEVCVDTVATSAEFTTGNAKDASLINCFKGVRATISQTDGKNSLTITKGTTGWCMHCNQSVTWTAKSSLSGANVTDGHYYLSGNIAEIGTRISIRGDVIIDLNGKNLNTGTKGFNIYYDEKDTDGDGEKELGNLYILDSVGLGYVTNGKKTTRGGIIFNDTAGTSFTLYSGNLISTGTAVTGTGGGIIGLTTCSLNIHGGVIDGGTTTQHGGNIYMGPSSGSTSTFNMTGGLIINGRANSSSKNGGNIYVTNGVTTTITGGRIMGGEAANHGGNIYVAAGNAKTQIKNICAAEGTAGKYGGNILVTGANDLEISNISAYNGTVATDSTNKGRGGNIHLDAGTAVMEDVVLLGGEAYYGGSFYTTGNVTMREIITLGGAATDSGGGLYFNGSNKNISLENVHTYGGSADSDGGNIRFGNPSNVELFKNVTMTDGQAGGHGGNLDISTQEHTLNMENVKAIGGTATTGGGNICVGGASVIDTFKNITMIDGEANNGGNLEIRGAATINMEDVKADSGIAVENGGNISISAAATITMNDGEVVAGEAGANGGNISISAAANVAILNAEIAGGVAGVDGGNIHLVEEIALNLEDTQVSGGVATGNGGNVCAAGAATVTGGEISEGSAVEGGNVYAANTIALDGVTLADGVATGNGGNVYAAGAATVTGGEISDGSAVKGGNVYAANTIALDGVTLVGGTASDCGGSIYGNNNITIAGCEISGGTALAGGNVYMVGAFALDIDDSVISSGTATGTAGKNGTGNGGNIYSGTTGATLVMTNTTVSDGVASDDAVIKGRGGNVYFNNGEATIDNCTLKDGHAYYGGNLYANKKITLTNVNSIGGYAVDAGGGIYHNGSAEASFYKVTATGGKTGEAGAGGNIRFASSTVTKFDEVKMYDGEANNGGNLHLFGVKSIHLENVVAEDGVAHQNGGNICVAGSTEAFAMTGCTVSGGTAIGSYNDKGNLVNGEGGNVYIDKAITADEITMTDCTVENGRARTVADVTNIRAENIYTTKNLVLNNVQVSSDSGMNSVGSGVHATSNTETITVTLMNGTELGSENDPLNGALYLHYQEGTIKVTDEESGEETTEKVTYTAQLKVDESFDGHAVVNVYTIVDAGYREEPYGQETLNIELLGDALNGKLYVGDHRTGSGNGHAIWSICMPEIFLNEAGKLEVGSGVVLTNAESKTFYQNTAEAIEAYQNGDIIKVVASLAVDVSLNGGEYIIDTNGNTVNLSGSGKVIGFDSQNKSGKTAGSANYTGEEITFEAAATVDGENYVAIVLDTIASFHHITMDITKVTLRTGNAGIFYKGQWNCDKELEAYLQSNDALEFGVVVSTTDMPEADFATENTEGETPNLYSAYGVGAFERNVEKTGVCVTNIMKATNDPADNAAKCARAIYARAYLYLGDGEYLVGGTGADLNLLDVAKRIDDALAENADFATEGNRAALELMNEFYGTWKNLGLKDAKDVYAKPFTTVFQDVEEA